MILDIFKSQPAPKTAFPRCEHRSPAGRQCSQPICSTSPQFCFTHKPKPDELTIAELTEAAGTLSTPEEINHFLTRVTLLRIQGRLTPKEACAYAYLCQILQRGHREIAFHQKLRDEREAEKSRANNPLSSWSLPRPDRSDPPDEQTPLVGAGLARPELQGARPAASTSPATDPTVELSPCSSPACSTPSSATDTLVEVSPSVSCQSTSASPLKKSPRSKSAAKSSESSTSSSTSSIPPDFYNHFYPIDPTLPPNLQDHRKNIPPPDEIELRARERRRGFLPPRLYRKASARFFGLWR